MTGVVGLWQVPRLPADPEALAAAAESLTSAVRDLAPDTSGLLTAWEGIAGPYDTPHTGELILKMKVVGEAGEDFATSLSSAAGALSTLADALAAAKYRIDRLAVEIPQLRQQVTSSRADLQEQYGDDANPAGETWAPGQYEWNERLLAECAAVQALLDEAAVDCERDLRRIEDVPFRVDAAIGGGLPAALGTPITQDAAFQASLSLSILNRLSADDGANAAALIDRYPTWLTVVQRTPPPADQVHAWWAGMNAAAAAALTAAAPRLVGNLEGVAYAARDNANRVVLELDLISARQAVEAAQQLPPLWLQVVNGESVMNRAALQYAAAQAHLSALEDIQRALHTSPGHAQRSLISLTSDDPPLAAIAIGDLDTATNVTYAVPGMGTTTDNMRGWTSSAQNLYDMQARVAPDQPHAVVAWVGYETPPIPVQQGGPAVFDTRLAETGATKLNSALAGVHAVGAEAPASINVVAHSYGTTTAAIALSQPGSPVNTFVSVGSAGLPESVNQASALRAQEVYAGQARNVIPAVETGQGDQWAWTGRTFGNHPVDPVDPGFGAIAFGVDGDNGMLRVTDHSTGVEPEAGSGYLDPQTESLMNVAYATTGNSDQISVAVPKGLTPLQELLLQAAQDGAVGAY